MALRSCRLADLQPGLGEPVAGLGELHLETLDRTVIFLLGFIGGIEHVVRLGQVPFGLGNGLPPALPFGPGSGRRQLGGLGLVPVSNGRCALSRSGSGRDVARPAGHGAVASPGG